MSFKGVYGLLQKNILTEFMEKFDALDGQKANVQIKHIFYGSQKLNRCVLHPFADEERIGLIMDDGEKKYIYTYELQEVSINSTECYIKSEVMELYINYML